MLVKGLTKRERDHDRGTYHIPEMEETWPAVGKLKAGEAYSVTTILDVIGKPWLVPWAAKVERQACIDAASAAFGDRTREAFLVEMDAQLGPTREHNKVMNEASDIGSKAHALIEAHVGRMLDPSCDKIEKSETSDKAFELYSAWIVWAQEVEFKPVFAEKTVYIPNSDRFAGTVDCLAYVRGRLTVCDWKTSSKISVANLMQVTAYAECCEHMGMTELYVHGLDEPDGLILRLPKAEDDAARLQKKTGFPFEERIVPMAEQSKLYELFGHAKLLFEGLKEAKV